jgi:isopentenyl-diphosphate delta-isomerase
VQHIDLALAPESQTDREPFGEVLLPYTALPELDLAAVDTSVELLGKRLQQPLIIASMTGGSQHAKTINTHLAIAAETMQAAMGVGSQRIALEVADARETFALVRRLAPTTVIFANMGAVQLNYGRTVDDYRRVVEMIGADALYLHLNPLQEAIQPGGDANFAGLRRKIEDLVARLGAPVFVKEVGHGLDAAACQALVDAGVAGLDVAGVGGTSWAYIEARRADNPNLMAWFKDVGWPTEAALRLAARHKGAAKLVASGGIRGPVQGLKARLLGADYYSAARPFLVTAMESPEAVIALLADWQKGLQIGLFAIGAVDWEAAGSVSHDRMTR